MWIASHTQSPAQNDNRCGEKRKRHAKRFTRRFTLAMKCLIKHVAFVKVLKPRSRVCFDYVACRTHISLGQCCRGSFSLSTLEVVQAASNSRCDNGFPTSRAAREKNHPEEKCSKQEHPSSEFPSYTLEAWHLLAKPSRALSIRQLNHEKGANPMLQFGNSIRKRARIPCCMFCLHCPII